MRENTHAVESRRRNGRIAFYASCLLLSGSLTAGTLAPAANAADLELKSNELGNIKKIEPESKPKLEKISPKPKKTRNIKPAKTSPAKSIEKPKKASIKPGTPEAKLVQPDTKQLKKLNVSPDGGKPPKTMKRVSVEPPAVLDKSLKKGLIKPPSKPLATDLKPTKTLPGSDAVASPLKAQGGAGVQSTNAAGLRLDPDDNLSKQLAAPDVKALAVQPRIREGVSDNLKESLSSKLDRDSVTESNLQGLTEGKNSSLGDRAGITGRLGDGSYLSRQLEKSLSELAGPSPGSRVGRVLDGYDVTFDDPNGKVWRLYIVSESTAEAAGGDANKILENDGYDPDNFDAVLPMRDVEYKFMDTTDGQTSLYFLEDFVEEKWENNANDSGGDESGTRDSSGTQNDGGTGNEDQSADDTATGLANAAESAQDDANSDSESSDDDTDSSGSDGGDGDTEVAEDDTTCPEGDENCNETSSEGGGDDRTVDGGQENPSDCTGGKCKDQNPGGEAGDGTVRTAGGQEDEKGGPLRGDTDTSPANGTLRLANEEEPAGELVRGDDALEPAGDRTLRMPEGEDDEGGGTPQVAGGSGGDGIGNPGVVTNGAVSGGANIEQNLDLQNSEVNIDGDRLENFSGQAGQ